MFLVRKFAWVLLCLALLVISPPAYTANGSLMPETPISGDNSLPPPDPEDPTEPYRIYMPCAFQSYCQSAEPSPFGIQIAALHEFIQPDGDANNRASGLSGGTAGELPVLAQALKDSGAGWARVYIDWASIQPTAPSGGVASYNWAWYDRALALVASSGVQINGNISNPPFWMRAGSPPCANKIDAAKIEYARDFMAAIVNRYKVAPYNIHVWELINEPDAIDTYGCNAGGQPQLGIEYADLLEQAYPVIKATDPEAKVIMGGIAYDWFYASPDNLYRDGVANGKFNRYFIDDVFSSGASPGGAAEYVDAINFHYFRSFHAEWEQWTNDMQPTCGYYTLHDRSQPTYAPSGYDVLAKGTHILGRLKTCYGVEKPFWITEVGQHGIQNPPGNSIETTLDNQARYVFTVHARALALGAENVTWYALKIYHPLFPGDYQGLLFDSRDGALNNQPKPAFYAYQTLARELAGYHYKPTGNRFYQAEAYTFSHPCQPDKTIAWSYLTTGFVPFTVDNARTVKLVYRPDQSGTPVQQIITDGSRDDLDRKFNGSITFALTIEPVIIQTIP